MQVMNRMLNTPSTDRNKAASPNFAPPRRSLNRTCSGSREEGCGTGGRHPARGGASALSSRTCWLPAEQGPHQPPTEHISVTSQCRVLSSSRRGAPSGTGFTLVCAVVLCSPHRTPTSEHQHKREVSAGSTRPSQRPTDWSPALYPAALRRRAPRTKGSGCKDGCK